ncbi:uncharacterized protein LAJ45_07180 [Morchella importuna]|uniref:uncharacterized protein n=1 Tax=Morchella importuna TaxID=1174673 RepID=UPI001E8D5249|nr:uncharacterized protein LAJ45_07180 [Morchella importuna]KAH8148837.1 hypothetical protein LAJ45_07180 [Morchella importuna]
MEPNPPLLNSGREEGTDHSSPLLRYPPHPYIEDAESKDVQYESEPTSFHGPSRMDVSSTDSFPGALPGQLLIEYPGSLPTEDLEEERPINPPNTPQTLSESSFSYGTPCRHTELEESLDSFDSEETESIYENDATSQNLSSAVGLPPHVPYIQETPAVSIESQFEPFQLETIEEEPVEGTTASGVNTMDEEPRLQKETPRSTSFTAILNEDEEEIESDENELSVQFIENIEDESPANPENSLHHAFKTDRNESPQSTTRVGSGSLSLESMVSSGFLKFLIDKKVTYYSRLIYLYLAIYKLAENSTVASLDIKAAGENHKSAEAEDKDEDENEDEDMLFSVPMARKVIPKGTALKLTISIPSGSEDSTRLPTSPKRDVYDPTSLRKPGPVKMESLEYGLVTRRRGILPPPSLKLPPVSSIPQEPPPSYEESMGLTNDPGVLLKDPFDGSDSESDSDSDSDDDDDEDEDAFDPNNEDDLYDTASSRLDVLDRLIAETKASRSFSLRKEPINTTTEVGSNEYEGKHLPSQEHQHLDATTTRPDYNENGPLIFRKPPRKEYRETFRLEPHPRISKTQHVGNIPLQPLSIGGSQAEPYDLSVNKLTSVPIPSNDTPSITPEDDMNRSSSLKLSNNSRDNLSGPRMVFKRDLGSKDRKGYSDMINILQGVINTLERPISMSELEISTAVDKSQIIVDSNSTSQRAKTHFSSSNALCSSEMASHIEEDRIEEDGGGEREKAQKELSENESEESDEPRSKDGDRSSTDDDQNSDHGPSSGGAEIMTGHTTSDHQDNQERGNSNTDSPPRENDGKTSLSSSNNSKTWGHHILNCEYMLEPRSTELHGKAGAEIYITNNTMFDIGLYITSKSV